MRVGKTARHGTWKELVMIMHLTAAQARTIARLANELGGSVALHQIAEGDDVYVSHPGMLSEILVDAEGATASIDRHTKLAET